MDAIRTTARRAGLALVLTLMTSLAPPAALGQMPCDANGDSLLTVSDGVQVLRAAADLSSTCTLDTCDTNGDGVVGVADGVNVLRAAASLPSVCDDAGTTPTPTPTPRGPEAARGACHDDCRAAQRVCGDAVFFDEHDSVDSCTEDCLWIIDDYALDAPGYDACVEAHVHFIDCCTNEGQCGDIPDGCGAEFNAAVDACGGAFSGCPLIFF